MRRIIASEFISADGYIVGPNEDMTWVTGSFNEEMGKYAGDLMSSMDTILLGRVTYQMMAGAWPNLTEAQSLGADRMNNTPKVVLSRTLKKAPWGKYESATIVGEEVEQKIRILKQKQGNNIVIYGSAQVVQSLSSMGLIDEYQLLVHPVFLGAGKPLFAGMHQPTQLKLIRSQTYSNGVNALFYERASSPQSEKGNAGERAT